VCGCHGRTATSNHCVHSPGNCTVTATVQFLDPTFRIGLTARIVSAPILADGCVPIGSTSSAPTATSLPPYRPPEERPIRRCCVQRCTLIGSSAERPLTDRRGLLRVRLTSRLDGIHDESKSCCSLGRPSPSETIRRGQSQPALERTRFRRRSRARPRGAWR